MSAFSRLHHDAIISVVVVFSLLVASMAPLAESFQPKSMKMRRRASLPALNAIADAPLPPEYAEEEKDERKKEKKTPRHGRDVVLRVETIQDYKDVVVNEKEQITVVRFYARWCKSCRAAESLFYKLASDFSKQNVKFVEVPLNKRTAVLHEALGVPSVPWTHIYHPDAGLVEERKVSKKHIDDVRKCLRCYVYGECDLADDPANCLNVYGECDLDPEEPSDGSWE